MVNREKVLIDLGELLWVKKNRKIIKKATLLLFLIKSGFGHGELKERAYSNRKILS